MKLKVLSYQDVQQARIWRNDEMSMNRTSFLITEETQGKFYQEQVCNRHANAKYWGIWEEVNKDLNYGEYIVFNGSVSFVKKDLPGFPVIKDNPLGCRGYDTEQLKTAVDMLKKQGNFIGMGEITSISLENRLGEIGLIIHPEHTDKAEKAIKLILEQGFNNLNLENIYGESYLCNPRLSIWMAICERFDARCCYLPNRKFWAGNYHDSLYFNINREDWKK